MPSFKSCLATLAIMAVAFAPITAAAGHKTSTSRRSCNAADQLRAQKVGGEGSAS